MPASFLSRFKKSAPRPAVIVVSGLPRSGTSMMMKMLAAGGLPILTDNERRADENNPRGYYEFEPVKQLREGVSDWVPQAEGKVVKIISALLEHLPAGHTYKIIFMRRHIDEILASQRRMLERDGKPTDRVSDEQLAELYRKHLAQVEAWLAGQPNMEVLYVSYNDILTNPDPIAAEVNTFLGGRLDLPAMRQVVDRNLYRERKST